MKIISQVAPKIATTLMRSKRTFRFITLFKALTEEGRKQTYAAYQLFKSDPYHPSLHFKKISLSVYSARVGISYRVLGRREEDDLIVWFWIGTHAEYDKLLAQR
jgi:hypothetical protein